MNLTPEEKSEWDAYMSLSRYAQEVLGASQWNLLRYFGKLMDGGCYSGLYVSGLPSCSARIIVDELLMGKIVPVHLMHRHRSGVYEASSLMRRNGQLIMLFDDRCEFA